MSELTMIWCTAGIVFRCGNTVIALESTVMWSTICVNNVTHVPLSRFVVLFVAGLFQLLIVAQEVALTRYAARSGGRGQHVFITVSNSYRSE